MRIGVLIVLMAACAASGGSPALTGPAMRVCEVLANDPTRLNGRLIRVRGYFDVTDHGMWLSEECEGHLVTKGLTWGNNISIYVDAADDGIARSWNAFSSRLRVLHANLKKDRVWLTIVGRIETRKSMDEEVVLMPYGLTRAGFGENGDSAAEINVDSVEDVSVERGRAN